jgi:hypothetical protein
MPSRALHHLSYACIALVAAYLALISVTLYFASVRSALSSEIRVHEGAVAALETEYYDAISRLSAGHQAYDGFASPVAVEYVTEGGDTAVTRADR